MLSFRDFEFGEKERELKKESHVCFACFPLCSFDSGGSLFSKREGERERRGVICVGGKRKYQSLELAEQKGGLENVGW